MHLANCSKHLANLTFSKYTLVTFQISGLSSSHTLRNPLQHQRRQSPTCTTPPPKQSATWYETLFYLKPFHFPSLSEILLCPKHSRELATAASKASENEMRKVTGKRNPEGVRKTKSGRCSMSSPSASPLSSSLPVRVCTFSSSFFSNS